MLSAEADDAIPTPARVSAPNRSAFRPVGKHFRNFIETFQTFLRERNHTGFRSASTDAEHRRRRLEGAPPPGAQRRVRVGPPSCATQRRTRGANDAARAQPSVNTAARLGAPYSAAPVRTRTLGSGQA